MRSVVVSNGIKRVVFAELAYRYLSTFYTARHGANFYQREYTNPAKAIAVAGPAGFSDVV
jgi:hypothetical protein